jgi:hypothetical protein
MVWFPAAFAPVYLKAAVSRRAITTRITGNKHLQRFSDVRFCIKIDFVSIRYTSLFFPLCKFYASPPIFLSNKALHIL